VERGRPAIDGYATASVELGSGPVAVALRARQA
jgi:hypothetical protein